MLYRYMIFYDIILTTSALRSTFVIRFFYFFFSVISFVMALFSVRRSVERDSVRGYVMTA